VYQLVLGDVGRLVSLGIAFWLAAFVALATLMRQVLFRVEPYRECRRRVAVS